jgi:ATP/maltotriose-dependent transcriptional regulator MalT
MQRVATQRDHLQGRAFADRSAPDECAAEADWDVLLKTKLTAPLPRHALIDRPTVLSRLTTAFTGPLTLIAAPAGFGKTAALYDWLRRQQRAIAWVSLDASDNLPGRIWRYITAALHAACPAVHDDLLALLHTPHPHPIEAILIALINAITSASDDIILVLDDYHVIDTPAIHAAITFLIEHMPPQLHLVIASRADPPLPLARLRASGALSELRAADLRLTPEETGELLRQTMQRTITHDDIAALAAHTEGWAAGVQLIALAMNGHTDPQRFIASLCGGHPAILEYLTDEVLRQQPTTIQQFLLHTAILERLSGPVCDAVCDQQDSQAVLQALERANVLIAPLDDERR